MKHRTQNHQDSILLAVGVILCAGSAVFAQQTESRSVSVDSSKSSASTVAPAAPVPTVTPPAQPAPAAPTASSAPAGGQAPASAPLAVQVAPPGTDLVKSEIVKVTEEMQTVSRQLFEARRKFADDPEIKAARDAIQKAQKAYEDLMNTKLKGNPELEPLMKKMEELKAQRKQIEEQMRAPAPVPSPRAPVKP